MSTWYGAYRFFMIELVRKKRKVKIAKSFSQKKCFYFFAHVSYSKKNVVLLGFWPVSKLFVYNHHHHYFYWAAILFVGVNKTDLRWKSNTGDLLALWFSQTWTLNTIDYIILLHAVGFWIWDFHGGIVKLVLWFSYGEANDAIDKNKQRGSLHITYSHHDILYYNKTSHKT